MIREGKRERNKPENRRIIREKYLSGGSREKKREIEVHRSHALPPLPFIIGQFLPLEKHVTSGVCTRVPGNPARQMHSFIRVTSAFTVSVSASVSSVEPCSPPVKWPASFARADVCPISLTSRERERVSPVRGGKIISRRALG